MSNDRNLESLKRGWSDLAEGNMDSLADAYAEDMIFVLPGQKDVLEGRQGFRAALDNIGAALPPGCDMLQSFQLQDWSSAGNAQCSRMIRVIAPSLRM